jgi:PhnB protein
MASEYNITDFRITLTPMLSMKNAEAAIEFYKQAFGAAEAVKMIDEGKVSHCELRIGDAVLMLSDEYWADEAVSPLSLGGSPVLLLLEVADVDTVFAQAIAAGGTEIRPVNDAFGGIMRMGKFNDPFGHRWMLMTKLHRADEIK